MTFQFTPPYKNDTEFLLAQKFHFWNNVYKFPQYQVSNDFSEQYSQQLLIAQDALLEAANKFSQLSTQLSNNTINSTTNSTINSTGYLHNFSNNVNHQVEQELNDNLNSTNLALDSSQNSHKDSNKNAYKNAHKSVHQILSNLDQDLTFLNKFRQRGQQRNCTPKLPLHDFLYGHFLNNLSVIVGNEQLYFYKQLMFALMTLNKVQQEAYFFIPRLYTAFNLKPQNQECNFNSLYQQVLQHLQKQHSTLSDSELESLADEQIIQALNTNLQELEAIDKLNAWWISYLTKVLAQPKLFWYFKNENLYKTYSKTLEGKQQLEQFYLELTEHLTQLFVLLNQSSLIFKYSLQNQKDVEFYIANRMRSIESVTQKQFTAFNKIKLKPEQEIAFLIELMESSLMQQLPIARVAQISEFGDHVYNIGAKCLIPRDDSMQLVYRAQDYLSQLVKLRASTNDDRAINILDLCAGTGCLGLESVFSVANFYQERQFNLVFAELKSEYSRIIRNNLLTIFKDLNNVSFTFFGNFDIRECDISSTLNWTTDLSLVVKATNNQDPTNISVPPILDSYDLIICNPPYISKQDIYLKYIKGEDELSLTDGKDGLSLYEKIFVDSYANLNLGGKLIIESGYDQQQELEHIIESLKDKVHYQVESFRDYSDNHRGFVLTKIK